MSRDAIIHFFIAVSIIVANVVITLALCYMKNMKRTTVILLANLALSNLPRGIMFIIKAVLFVWHVNTVEGCLFIMVFSGAPSGSYVTGILFIYLDVYLSLKKMAIGRPVISTRLALIMATSSWSIWLALGFLGFSMRNENYVYNHGVGCFLQNGVYINTYILLLCVIYISIFIAVLIFHLMTYRLIKRSKALSNTLQIQVQTINGHQINLRELRQKRTNWLKKNDTILKMLLLVLITFALSWYPLIIVILVTSFCKPCVVYITKEVVYFSYALEVIQYNSNGVIYLIKIKECRDSCQRICCRYLSASRQIGPSSVTANLFV